MMNRRRFLLTSLAGALAMPLMAEAQQAKKIYVIGMLSMAGGPSPIYGRVFSDALRERGWEAGRNLTLEPRYAAGSAERLPDLAADLLRRKVDVILAFG